MTLILINIRTQNENFIHGPFFSVKFFTQKIYMGIMYLTMTILILSELICKH